MPLTSINEFVTAHDLEAKVTLSEGGHNLEVTEGVYNAVVLEGAGITVEQYQKKTELEQSLLAGIALVGGERAKEAFEADPNLSELGLTCDFGGNSASAIYNRDTKDMFVEVTHPLSTEMENVLKHVDGLFEDLNS